MTSTTKGSAASTTNPFSTDRANGPQFPPLGQDRTSIMTHQFTEGQYVHCMHETWPVPRAGFIVAYVPPAAATGHDTPAWIVAYPPSPAEHPAVQALAIYEGMHRGLFTADELSPISADDAPPATAAEVVEYVTGVAPATSNLDSWTCSQCGWETHAAGPVDVDEPDPFQESIDEHRRGHAPEEPVYQPGREPRDVHPGWYEVPTIPLWMALRTVPSVLNALTAVMATPPADVAQALRAVADVLAGDEK